MNSQDVIQIFAYIVVAISLALIMLDHPAVFHYRPLRFFYRFGLILYSHVFKVSPQSNKLNIPQWKLEHWMSILGSSLPRAEEDGERRYILMEFVAPFFQPIPLLMRAKISWDNKENNVIIHGYATWTYLIILIFLVTPFFDPRKRKCESLF
jgi:hypothetical protein